MANCIHVCWKCEKRFSTEARFHDHYTVDHSSKAEVCSVCDKKFPNTLVLDGHANAHSMNAHSCNTCGEFCSTWVDLYIHVTVFHKYGGNFVCDLCKSTFSLRCDLKQHLLHEHCSKQAALEQTAELSCTIHSSQSFPDEDGLIDSLIGNDVFRKHLQAELDKNGKYAEPREADTHSDRPKLDGPVSKPSSVRHATTPAMPKQVTADRLFPFHLNENELVDNSQPKTQMQLTFTELYSQHSKLNAAVPTHSVTIRNKLSANERNRQTQQESFRQYLCFLSKDNFSADGKLYVCDVCGMKFEDINSFLVAHVSSDSYVGIA